MHNIPVGTIVPFAGTRTVIKNLKGWLLCNGQAVNRQNYSNLFQCIGTLWGAGNNDTTFNVPDLRGQFLRGADTSREIDPDTEQRERKYNSPDTDNTEAGSYQKDMFKKHTHQMPNSYLYQTGPLAAQSGGGACDPFSQGIVNPDETGGSETRPKNAYVNYIIKAE